MCNNFWLLNSWWQCGRTKIPPIDMQTTNKDFPQRHVNSFWTTLTLEELKAWYRLKIIHPTLRFFKKIVHSHQQNPCCEWAGQCVIEECCSLYYMRESAGIKLPAAKRYQYIPKHLI